MKKVVFCTTVCTVLLISIQAQDTAANKSLADTSATTTKIKEWTKSISLNAALSQIGNSNWMSTGGDEFTLSGIFSIHAFANRQWGRRSWHNTLDVNYGLVNTSTLGLRKINDRLDIISKYTWRPKKWNKAWVGMLGQLRSQLASGYQYNYFGTTEKRRNSGFFAPAYIVVTPGIDWRPNNWFSMFSSPLAVRWTVVSNGPYSYLAQGGIFNDKIETPLAKFYGINPASPNRGEVGTFVTLTAKKEVLKNVDYYGKFDFYFSYIRNNNNVSGRNRPDIFWTNQFRFKINKFLNVSYALDMLYDDDIANPNKPAQALGLQVLSTFGIGLSTRL
ncbi:MAG TPA: DUF3078 domain-containing protein [Ferruginibacter sp.]|nr:DUF3078 domain-containing protein [Ferruginibacter sp.]